MIRASGAGDGCRRDSVHRVVLVVRAAGVVLPIAVVIAYQMMRRMSEKLSILEKNINSAVMSVQEVIRNRIMRVAVGNSELDVMNGQANQVTRAASEWDPSGEGRLRGGCLRLIRQQERRLGVGAYVAKWAGTIGGRLHEVAPLSG